MRKVCVVVTARPSYSRIRSALRELTRPDRNTLVHVIAGASALVRRFGCVVEQIREDDYFDELWEVPAVLEGGGTRESAISTAVLLTQLTGVLDAIKPDMVVTIADRHETLATAISASYQNLPLCHVQGGEVSGSIDDKVRNAITQLADLHLVSNEAAASNVLRMRPDADVQITGCPSIDVAEEARKLGPIRRAEVVVLQHPVTTECEQAGLQMRETIAALKPLDDRVLWLWPGEDAGGDDMSKELRLAGIKPVRNLPPVDFLRVLLGAKVLVGNSSVAVRECSFLGVPAVNIGSRQKGREHGPNLVSVGHNARDIRQAVFLAMQMKAPSSHLYGDGKAGERIADILAAPAVEAVA